MLTPAPPQRKRRGRDLPISQSPPTPPPPAPLVLVAATYDDVNLLLLLTFDRPVNAVGFDGSALQVGDPTFNNTAYDGAGGAFVVAPGVVQINLAATGPYFGTEVDFTATGASGIVATDDGGTWAGTGGIMFLPYP